MPFDTIIRGGTIATAADTFSCDVAIRDGRIVALGHDLGDANTIIDATDRALAAELPPPESITQWIYSPDVDPTDRKSVV